jgi:sodium-dependent dicarboxylate transporter 2/3/5
MKSHPQDEAEFADAYSPGEARFEALRKKTGFFAAPALFLALWLVPMPGLTPEAHTLAAIMALVVCLWVTEALPLAVTGLLGPTLAVVLGVAPAQKAFSPFADPIMFLFLGAFVLARAISEHNLDKRFAYRILSLRWVGDSPGRILFAYGAVCCFISMWISNTATVAMMFPIGLAIIRTLRSTDGAGISNAYASAMMLICAFGASIGGLATPVGTPTNLIGLGFIGRQLGRHVSFAEWMGFGVPIVVTLFLLLFGYLCVLCPAGVRRLNDARRLLVQEHERLGSVTKGERNTMIAFGLTVALWLTPGILTLALGDAHPATAAFSRHVPESAAAMIGACLLFVLPLDWGEHRFTLDLRSALQIDWGVMALYGGGIALGQLVFDTKLAEVAGQSLAGFLPSSPHAGIPLFAAAAALTSEFTSNVASANMVVPVVILVAGATGLQGALAATMASSLGFMLPISTPTNAIVYSSGCVRLSDMVKYGLLLDVIGVVVIYLASLFLLPAQ